MIKAIWYGNAALVLSALLVLFFGLPDLGNQSAESTLTAGEPDGSGSAGAAGSMADGLGNVKETVLVAAARKYSERWKPPTGSVQISLAPDDIAGDQARWRVDGGEWQKSNAMVSELPVGKHKISFKPISEWTKPSDMTLNVARKKTSTARGVYHVIEKGSVRVIIEPEELLEFKPQWRVDNNPWQDSGATMEGVLAGQHSVTFKNIPDWNVPRPIPVVVAHEQRAEATGIYVLKPVGSLTVTLGPEEALSAQAEWRIDNGPWQKSGVTLNKIAVGPHQVHARQIAEWWQPDSLDVVIKEDETTEASIGYEPVLYGSVFVDIIPAEAAEAGVQWRIDANAWQDSNTVDDRVVVGPVHKLYFNPGQQWEEMDSVDVEVVEGQLARFIVEFTEKPPPPPPGLSIQTTLAYTNKPHLGQAWIKSLADKRYKVYSVGDEIVEYKVESITPGEVIFSKRGFKYALQVPVPQIGVAPKGVTVPPQEEQRNRREMAEPPPGERRGLPIRPPGSGERVIR